MLPGGLVSMLIKVFRVAGMARLVGSLVDPNGTAGTVKLGVGE